MHDSYLGLNVNKRIANKQRSEMCSFFISVLAQPVLSLVVVDIAAPQPASQRNVVSFGLLG